MARFSSRIITKNIRNAVLYLCKSLGLFWVSRIITKRSLRILCYHGFSQRDEHLFRPGLFISPRLFMRRLDKIEAYGFHILPLADAADQLTRGALKPNSLVITIDDGFYNVHKIAYPILARRGIPATLFVTSYYVKHNGPIFRIALQYLFWKTHHGHFRLPKFHPNYPAVIKTKGILGRHDMWRLIDYGESILNEKGRRELLRSVADALEIDLDGITKERLFDLLKANEIREMAANRVDIQLHTHRHRMPEEKQNIREEIDKNREFLEPIVGYNMEHFCYPSGVCSEERWPTLRECGIKTACTCEGGLNTPRTETLALKRILDMQNVSPLEFEAELTGFMELLRSALRMLTGRNSTSVPYPAPIETGSWIEKNALSRKTARGTSIVGIGEGKGKPGKVKAI
ncbi:MAG: polysaccharide deacetylase family protein [Chitinivibrionales bacterium]|nr:polysaccharide deacetylase family protein [Chitinivibrionales bacterium]